MRSFNRQFHHRQSIRLPAFDYSTPGAYFVTICTEKREHFFGEIVEGIMRENNVAQIMRYVWDELPLYFPGIKTDEFIIMPNHLHGIIWIHNPTPVGARFIAPLEQPIAPLGCTIAPLEHTIAPLEQPIAPLKCTDANNPTGRSEIIFDPSVNPADPSVGPDGPVIPVSPVGPSGAINRAPTLGMIVRTLKARATYEIHEIGVSYFGWQRNYYERIVRSEHALSAIRQYIRTNPLNWEADPDHTRL